MLTKLHPIAGVIGFVTILTFWLSTVTSELFGSTAAIAAVKETIPWGFWFWCRRSPSPARPASVGSASSDPRIVSKKRRMPIIAANGIFILIPAALYLAMLASRGAFGTAFYAVQAIELLAGAVNLSLMALNIRDGFRLTAGRRARRRATGKFATNA